MPSEFSLPLKGKKQGAGEASATDTLLLRYIITFWATVLYSENSLGVQNWMCLLLFL